MSLWSILEAVLDVMSWIHHWRFTVCLLGGIALAVVVADRVPQEPLRWILAGIVLLACVVVGWRWDNESQ